MRDQRGCQLVDPGIPGQGAGRDLGQLVIETPRQAFANFENVLLDYVEVVQQPLPGRSDIGAAIGRRGKLGIDLLEDSPGLIESDKKREVPPFAGRFGEPLCRGDGTGPFRQVLGTKQFAPDGAGTEVIPAFSGPLSRLGTKTGKFDGGDVLGLAA